MAMNSKAKRYFSKPDWRVMLTLTEAKFAKTGNPRINKETTK